MTHIHKCIHIKCASSLQNPQCFLGKKRLEKSIDIYKKTVPGGSSDTFSVTWLPYYLDPNLPKQGYPVRERMAKKFDADQLDAITKRLALMGQGEGINFTQQGKIGHTRDAHRLIQMAKTKSVEAQDKVVTEVMKSYFEEGGDITSHDMLIASGEKAGLEGAEVKKWLNGEDGGAEVDDLVEEAYQKGIRGVPHFTINDKFEVSGAQDVEVFLGEFVRAKEAA